MPVRMLAWWENILIHSPKKKIAHINKITRHFHNDNILLYNEIRSPTFEVMSHQRSIMGANRWRHRRTIAEFLWFAETLAGIWTMCFSSQENLILDLIRQFLEPAQLASDACAGIYLHESIHICFIYIWGSAWFAARDGDSILALSNWIVYESDSKLVILSHLGCMMLSIPINLNLVLSSILANLLLAF